MKNFTRISTAIAEAGVFKGAILKHTPLAREAFKLSRTHVSDPIVTSITGYRPLQSSALIKPILFCTFASGALHLGAFEYGMARYRQERSRPKEEQNHTPTSQESSNTLLGKAKEAWQKIPLFKANVFIYGIMFATFYNATSWRNKALQLVRRETLIKWSALPLPPQRIRPLITLLTSTFGHVGLAHLAIDMFALRWFGGKISPVFGELFLPFYLTAGMVSSLASYAGRLRSLRGGYSIGASGAVYACFAACSTLWPGILYARLVRHIFDRILAEKDEAKLLMQLAKDNPESMC